MEKYILFPTLTHQMNVHTVRSLNHLDRPTNIQIANLATHLNELWCWGRGKLKILQKPDFKKWRPYCEALKPDHMI